MHARKGEGGVVLLLVVEGLEALVLHHPGLEDVQALFHHVLLDESPVPTLDVGAAGPGVVPDDIMP